MRGTVWLGVLVVFAVGTGCGTPERFRIGTADFAATFDRGWRAERQQLGRGEGVLLERAERDLEVRVVGWPMRQPVASPTEEAMTRLWKDETLALAQAREEERCGAGHVVRMFGKQSRVVSFTSAGWRTLLVGGQAEGSLVAIVARQRPAGPGSCEGDQAVAALVQSFADGLAPTLPPPPRPWRTPPAPRVDIAHSVR